MQKTTDCKVPSSVDTSATQLLQLKDMHTGTGIMDVEFLEKKNRLELPFDPLNHSWVFTKKTPRKHHRDSCMSMFTVASYTPAKLCNQPRCPAAEEWKMGV